LSLVRPVKSSCCLQQPRPRTLLPGHWPPSLVPSYPGSLLQLRDAAAAFLLAGLLSPEAEHLLEARAHRDRQMMLMWLVTHCPSQDAALGSTRTQDLWNTSTASHVPSCSGAGRLTWHPKGSQAHARS